MAVWFTQAFNGLSLGSILLMISLGLAFSFGLMNVINMAHGEFIMIGAYVTYLFQQALAKPLGGADLGVWFILSIPAAFLATALLGVLLEIGLIRFLYGRPLDTLLATWGVGLILQQAARSIFGAPNVQVASPSWLSGAWAVAPGLLLPYKRLFIIGLVLVCVAGIYTHLYRTASGRRIRAAMQNREIAAALGVVGRLPGTIAAALLIGIFNTLLELGTTATLGKVLVFLLIIAFLQWRPAGLIALR